jgi:hypothetical protein
MILQRGQAMKEMGKFFLFLFREPTASPERQNQIIFYLSLVEIPFLVGAFPNLSHCSYKQKLSKF